MLSRAIVNRTPTQMTNVFISYAVYSHYVPFCVLLTRPSVQSIEWQTSLKSLSRFTYTDVSRTFIHGIYVFKCIQYVIRTYAICVIVDISFRCLVPRFLETFLWPLEGSFMGLQTSHVFLYIHSYTIYVRKEAFT